MMVKKTDQALDVCLCTFHYSWSSEAHFSVLVWSKNVTSIGINNLGTIQLNLQVKRPPSGYRQSGRSIAVRQQQRSTIKNGGGGLNVFAPPFPLPPINNKRWPLSFFVRRRQHCAGTSRVKKENRVQENTKGKGESSGEREHKEKKGQSGAREHQGERGKVGHAGTPRGKGKGEISGVRELQGDRGRGGNRVARKHEGKRRN